MTQPVYPPASAEIAERRKLLAPGVHDANTRSPVERKLAAAA
jgi:hypothetical protein